MQARQRASRTASSASLLLHRSVQQNIVQQSLGSKSNARKVSPVRKRWEEFTNRFLARLMSVFGDLKSLGVLNASPAKRARERERSQCSALPTSRSCANEGRRHGKCSRRASRTVILFAFDPRQTGILLIGRRKGAKDWYRKMIALAERLYAKYLMELKKEGLL